MAKKKPATQPESITIRYELYELPTAQHKAGLAGLLLQIDSMNERVAAGGLPTSVQSPIVEEMSAAFCAVTIHGRIYARPVRRPLRRRDRGSAFHHQVAG